MYRLVPLWRETWAYADLRDIIFDTLLNTQSVPEEHQRDFEALSIVYIRSITDSHRMLVCMDHLEASEGMFRD
eukprot:51844-Eustigmatos_ZCMA.PRE.1